MAINTPDSVGRYQLVEHPVPGDITYENDQKPVTEVAIETAFGKSSVTVRKLSNGTEVRRGTVGIFDSKSAALSAARQWMLEHPEGLKAGMTDYGEFGQL